MLVDALVRVLFKFDEKTRAVNFLRKADCAGSTRILRSFWLSSEVPDIRCVEELAVAVRRAWLWLHYPRKNPFSFTYGQQARPSGLWQHAL